jgi:4-hydroxybenzoate polyprenyltransferase
MPDAMSLIRLARPHQYVKNVFIFAPVFFGSKLADLHALAGCLLAFCAFCLLASGVYVFNDMRDVESDRLHPVKRNRPLASGLVSRGEAAGFAVLLVGASFCLGLFLRPESRWLLAAYLLLNVGYSLWLKHVAILDITCIALGFVLRVYVGTLEARLDASHWIVIMTFLLAMFLALAKRRDDLCLARDGQGARKCLDGYSFEFVSMGMVLTAGVVIVTYLLFSLSPEVIARYNTSRLYLTGFWVILGILRYLQIAFVEENSGSPTLVLLKDTFLQIIIAGWIASYYFIIYAGK